MRPRIGDHPVHPALVHFPMALWFSAVFWDLMSWWRPYPLWWQLAYWCLTLGLALSLPTILTGFVEYLGLPRKASSIDTAATHMLLMVGATIAFGTSWILRVLSGPTIAPSLLAVALGFLGAALLSVGGWLGGTLVYRYGLGRADQHSAPEGARERR